MKLYERIENNNFDEIDRNRAIELIEGGNGHLVYNENYFKLQKENEELKSQNKTLEELLQGNLYELYKYYKELADTYQGNCISVQKIKDKMKKEIETNEHIILGGRRNGKTLEYGKRLGRIEMCQELLEGRR